MGIRRDERGRSYRQFHYNNIIQLLSLPLLSRTT